MGSKGKNVNKLSTRSSPYSLRSSRRKKDNEIGNSLLGKDERPTLIGLENQHDQQVNKSFPTQLDAQPPSLNSFHLTNLNDFPTELLLKIFNFLSIKTRLRMRHVCRRWFHLTLIGLKEFTVGSNRTNSFDKLLPVDYFIWEDVELDNFFIAENQITRLEVLNLILEMSGDSLKRLHLSCIESRMEDEILDVDTEGEECSRKQKIRSLIDKMTSLLITNCPKLVSLIFNHHCSLQGNTTLAILKHLGPQLEELEMLDFSCPSFENVHKYLNPDRLRKFVHVATNDVVYRTFPNLIKTRGIYDIFRAHFHLPTNSHLDLLPNIQDYTYPYNYSNKFLKSLEPHLHKLRSLHLINCPDHFFDDGRPPVWLDKLTSLRFLTTSTWEIKFVEELVQHLPKLSRLSLEYGHGSSNGYRKIFPLISRLKHLEHFTLKIYFSNFCGINFAKMSSMPLISVLEINLGRSYNQATCKYERLQPFMQNLPRIFPNLIRFGITSHQFDWDIWHESLSKLVRLKCLYLKTNQANDTVIKKELIPFCGRHEILFFWNYCCLL